MARKLIDLTGHTQGRLTVICRAANRGKKTFWLCRCECGKEKEIGASSLRDRKTMSCGCLRLEAVIKACSVDITGKRFGRLVALSKVDGKSNPRVKWSCLCDCGRIVYVTTNALQSGFTNSCGCLATETRHRLGYGMSSFNFLIYSMRRGAEKRGYTWELSEEQVADITKRNCFYCGVKPYQEMSRGRSYGVYIYNGLDRVDNSRGYEIDNVVACCGQCNRAKMAMSYQGFIEWLERIADYRYSLRASQDIKAGNPLLEEMIT